MRRASDETVRAVLTTYAVWAVVGLSGNRARPAWGVAHWLQEQGKQVVPVHPRAEPVHGQPAYPTLADVPFPVDVVDVFVRSELAGAVVDEAVAIGARAVWMQLGVTDDAAFGRAEAAGLRVVQDDCPHIAGPRLLGWPP